MPETVLANAPKFNLGVDLIARGARLLVFLVNLEVGRIGPKLSS